MSENMGETGEKAKQPADGESLKLQPLRKRRLKELPTFRTGGMRWLYRALYPFFHCRVHIPREMQESGEPVVFIANHYNVFGPISFMVSVPLVSDIWINEALIDPESSQKSLHSGMKKLLPFLNEDQLARVCTKLARLTVYVLTQAGMIPVDRNQPSKLISTMRKSITALQEGHNLLIFPETGLPEYSLTSVTPFYSAFAVLGRLYYRKTGRTLRFCPCYIDEQHRQIRLGETVTYDPEADQQTEPDRVSEELNRRIREMAAESRGVEKEQSTPVRRTILFFCNLLRLLLLIPLLTMVSLPNLRAALILFLISEGLRVLFNAVGTTYLSSNRPSFLVSHGISILTDLEMTAWLAAGTPHIRWIVYALIANGAAILISNVAAFHRFGRCAGVNYFDSLASNLMFVLILQQILHIRVAGVVVGVIELAILATLAFSAGFALAFNARIGREESGESVAKPGAE